MQDDPLQQAMRVPLENKLQRWRRESAEREQRFAKERANERRKLDAAPIDWSAEIDQRVGNTREYLVEVIIETIAELTERQREAISDAVRPLREQLFEVKIANAELRIKLAELREQLAADGSKVLDLPALPLRGSRAN